MRNKKYLLLLVVVILLFSGTSVFASDKPLEYITGKDGPPIGTIFTRGIFNIWRYSSSQGGVGNQGNQGVWRVDTLQGSSTFSDENMMKMLRGQMPNDRITNHVETTYPLPKAVKEYLDNGGSVDNIKVKFLPKDIGEEQDFRNGWSALVPTGPVLDPHILYREGAHPVYRINPKEGTLDYHSPKSSMVRAGNKEFDRI